MASQFSDFYRQSAAVHETISALVSRAPGEPLDVVEITLCVREAHPDIGLLPTELAKVIIRAAKVIGVQLRDHSASEGSVIST